MTRSVLTLAALLLASPALALDFADDDGDSYTSDIDCDDTDPNVYPGADEVCDDGIDQDCDTVDEPCPDPFDGEDNDGDGVFTPEDCDDTDETIYPGHPELCDDVDHDCDGESVPDIDSSGPAYRDIDGDGYGDPATELIICGEPPAGWVWTAEDCNDADAGAYPGAPEVCDDGIDQDCDTVDAPCPDPDYDQDGDGYDTPEDCDDTNAAIYPGAEEVCDDGIDQDCDTVDEPCPDPLDSGDTSQTLPDDEGGGAGCMGSGTGSMYASLFLPLLLLRRRRR